jgi:aminomethyltransferase
MADATLQATAFHDVHVRLGARMVPFAGYHMPVQYSGLMDEHDTVRNAVGLFDVSHMGEVEIRGPKAMDVVQRLVTNDAAAIVDGQAMYTGLLYDKGTFVDDLIVYRYNDQRFFICCNASNHAKDYAWMKEHAQGQADVVDRAPEFSQIAVQGPKAPALCQRLTRADLDKVKFYHFTEGEVAGVKDVIIARTGYTGEDGFELYVHSRTGAVKIWDALMEKGADLGVKPIGLGARDTLRLEYKMALYGNDIDDEHTPLEAGLGWIVKFTKDFIGRPVLEQQKKEGVSRKLVGLEMDDGRIARHGYNVLDAAGNVVGVVTSGTQSPTLKKAIALAYVPTAMAEVGTKLAVDVRGKPAPGHVVKTPFLSKKK